jgi:hypothetical protein
MGDLVARLQLLTCSNLLAVQNRVGKVARSEYAYVRAGAQGPFGIWGSGALLQVRPPRVFQQLLPRLVAGRALRQAVGRWQVFDPALATMVAENCQSCQGLDGD